MQFRGPELFKKKGALFQEELYLPGPRFNIKMSSYQYRKSHCGDKTVVRSSYLHNGIPYTGKMSSLYWIRALVSLCLHEQVGDTIVDGWPRFECNFNVFADMILPYGSHCNDMTASPEPINGVTGTWLSCFATCDWLRALVHLYCDVMITTSATKTWWSCRSLGVDLLCLRKKIRHQNTMLMTWKECKFKDEDLKILGR